MPEKASWALLATCTRGLEEVLRQELQLLGHSEAACGRGAVSFSGGAAEVLRANLWLRTAVRVLRQLAEGQAGSREELYELAAGIAWEELVAPGQTVRVEGAGRGEGFRSTAFAALTVKDALVDRLRDRWGLRPDVARSEADVAVHLHLKADRAGLALDGSGEPISHRGYRPRGGPAPLAESLAAGLLLLAGYDGSQPLLEPMCGTGTIAIEAALIATRKAPGLARSFACERWPSHDASVVAELRARAREAARVAPARIVAADADPRAVAAARRNARAAGVDRVIEFERRDVRELQVPGERALIVANPPYGERLGDADQLAGLYREIGDAFKQRAAGATAWLLVGNPELAKSIGLRAARRIVLWNGPIECRLLRYDLYAGRRLG
ncbi:MAG: class I SAM-dependent RNA methyltransferase [Thermoanaerobaculales bacterium]